MTTAATSGGSHWAARLRAPWRWVLVSVLLAGLFGIAVWSRVQLHGIDRVRKAASTRLGTYAAALNAELRRHEVLPAVLALDDRLLAALTSPAAIGEANVFLREAQKAARVDAVYLIGTNGVAIASSNFDQPVSFVGQDYGYRPYVQEALRGHLGRFYAIGTTTGKPGYFLAAPVQRAQLVRGIVVVKVQLDEFDRLLGTGGDTLMVADERGVAFLTSRRSLLYSTLGELSADDVAAIARTRQYEAELLKPLVPGVDLREANSLRALPWLGDVPVEVVRADLSTWGWRLVLFASHEDAAYVASWVAVAASFGVLVVSAGILLWYQRREQRRELRAIDRHIQHRIARSTEHLQQRLAEQARTEALLRQTTDAAVQVGKLAVLGQMSVGISHELNQPLAAMRNYTDNTISLLTAGQQTRAVQNLQRLSSLVERMAAIVAHLRFHARKQPVPVRPVDVRQAVESAIQLLRGSGLDGPVSLDGVLPGLHVQADVVRLEQVLVNLLRNAREAAGSVGRVEVHAARHNDQVVIRVEDDGPGFTDAALASLFEPFFTTKPAGHGLGLGLAVSRMIVEGHGGRLEAARRSGGGAVLLTWLPASPSSEDRQCM